MRITAQHILFPLLFFICTAQYSQTKDTIDRKQIHINRVTQPPVIDGILDDDAWKYAAIANGFVERIPVNGRPIPDSLRTEVKIVYDDRGIYFGAKMYDPSPDKILKELTERDNIGNHDFFFILLNGYNDRQQSLQFIVTAAGVQYDAKMANDIEDVSWNAVWYSAVQINDDGWVAEVFIPYSELRFPEKDVQVWGLNMEREFRRERTRYSWNHVDNTKGRFQLYDGEIHGIQNIKTPVRLSLQPYISTYVNSFDGNSEVVFNGGMDLKYGINDAFTLDMVLIPDFGQTRFDDTILNLSAFEVQYVEQRPFFTEGTELFNKGNLFYSRRVGDFPTGDVTLTEHEELVYYPSTVDLINAAKVSGRTDSGLGIGVFNAITKNTYAEIQDTEIGDTRRALIEPLANYNVFVLDQRFRQNSSVTFVNTNVMREGHFRDANVTGLLLDLINKKNTFRYNVESKKSWVMTDSTKFGMEGRSQVAKISGKNLFTGKVYFKTKDFDINDLGFVANTNYINYTAHYGYRYLQPKGILNSLNLNFNSSYKRRLVPDMYFSYVFRFDSYFNTRDFLSFGGGFETTPFGVNDIYEPRQHGRHVKLPAYYNPWIWISTDYRKRFALDLNLSLLEYDERDRYIVNFRVSPRYRFSDQWKAVVSSSVSRSSNEQGYVSRLDEEIYFGQRDRVTWVNSLESQYIFNNTMAATLSFRHYLSEVGYHRFYTLETDGHLTDKKDYTRNHDTTYNSWNIDLRYTWWFAPGSQLTFLYRNSIETFFPESGFGFVENLDHLFDRPQLHSFSIRISYFLDYNRVKDLLQSNSVSSNERFSRPGNMMSGNF